MSAWLRSLEPWGAALLRLVLGVSMMYHGYGKVTSASAAHLSLLAALESYARYIGTLGLPPWLGYVSASTELLGGGLLVLGLLTRFAALMVVGNLLVALFAVTLHHGYKSSEYTLALLAMATMLIFVGGGAFTVDRKLQLD